MNSMICVDNSKDIIIIGAGGIGRETAYMIEEINKISRSWNIIGFVDDNSDMWKQCLNGYDVLGGLEYLKGIDKKTYVIIAMANCQLKRKIVGELKGCFEFATIVHPAVNISKYIDIGQGTIIYEGTVLTVNTTIGNHVTISGNCGIGHDTVIGDFSSILWGSNLSGYDLIGEEVFIGVGVNIIQNIKIDDGVKVDAGERVRKNM